MNIIKHLSKVLEYCDRTRTTRFSDYQLIEALRDGMLAFIDDRIGTKPGDPSYYQSSQAIRDELAPLKITANIIPVANAIAYPADYYRLTALWTTTGGIVVKARPTEDNSRTEEDPFRKSKPAKTYYRETSTGFKILCGTGTCTTTEMTYIKSWAEVSIGKESDKKTAGTALTNAVTYLVYLDEDAVYNGVTYYPGEVITGTGAALTSGTVIPVSVTQDCILDHETHTEIARIAARMLQTNINNYPQSQAIDLEIQKT